MSGSGWWYEFSVGSTTHVAALAAFTIAISAVVTLARRLRDSAWLPPLERVMIAGVAAVAVGAVVKDMLPGAASLHWLPLQICDLTGLIAPVALATRARPLRAVLHFSGLTLSAQGLFFPPIELGPAYFGFWSHFIGHGTIVGAALYDLLARGFRPRWRDVGGIAILYTAYVALVFPVNLYTGLNYGFVGNHPHPVLDHFGAWPARVPVLLLTGIAIAVATTALSVGFVWASKLTLPRIPMPRPGVAAPHQDLVAPPAVRRAA